MKKEKQIKDDPKPLIEQEEFLDNLSQLTKELDNLKLELPTMLINYEDECDICGS